MRIAVVGASGLIGRPLSDLLESQGHEVRRLHRSSATHRVDLRTGVGLAAALEGVDVVVNAVNRPPPRRPGAVMVGGTRRLLAASEAQAQHVLVSIVGVDALAALNGYYRAKLAQESLVKASGRPFSIVRCTQFHELLGPLALALAKAKLEIHSPALVQPVSAREAAAVVARTATAAPTGSTLILGGPQVLTLTQLRARRGIWAPAPIPGRIRRALAEGALTDASPDIRGVLTYAQWLAEARGRPWRPVPRRHRV